LCIGEVAAAVGPTPKATGFCDALDTSETRCAITIDKADCLTRAKIYSDNTLTDATACTTKSCSLIYQCAAATLTETMGSWALGGGLKPGRRCAGTASPCSNSYYSMASCQAAGCTFSGTCTGSVQPCASAGLSQYSCERQAGCTWSGTACSGTPTPCASQTSQTICQGYCYWQSQCTGTVPACATLSVAGCAMQPGCMVQDAP
jgi:hypothetical protein